MYNTGCPNKMHMLFTGPNFLAVPSMRYIENNDSIKINFWTKKRGWESTHNFGIRKLGAYRIWDVTNGTIAFTIRASSVWR